MMMRSVTLIGATLFTAVSVCPAAEPEGHMPTLSCFGAERAAGEIRLICRLTNNAPDAVTFDAHARAMPSLEVERLLDGEWKPLAIDLDPISSVALVLQRWESLKFMFSVPAVAEALRVTATFRDQAARRPIRSNIGRLVDGPEPYAGDVPRWCCVDLTPVEILERVHPKYPRDARWDQHQGNILVELVVDADGTTKDVRVLKGDPSFNDAVVEAMHGWKFKPARDWRDQAVRTYFFVQVDFRLR